MGDGVTSGVTVASVDVSPLMIAIGTAAGGLSSGEDESSSSSDGGAGGLPCGGRLIVVLPRVTAPSGVSVVPGPMMNSVTSLVTVAVIVEFPMTSAGKVGDAVVIASGVVGSMLEMVSRRSSESEMTGISADRAMADVRSWRVALEDLVDEEGLMGACRVLLVALDDEDKLVRTRGAVVLADLEDEEGDLEVDNDVDATIAVEAVKVGLRTVEVRTKEAA